jgi:hypothetical protein
MIKISEDFWIFEAYEVITTQLQAAGETLGLACASFAKWNNL